MTYRVFTFVALALVGAATSAAAPANDVEERRVTRVLYTCVAAKHPQLASDFVLRKGTSGRRAQGSLFENSCVDKSNGKLVANLQMKPDHLRFGLADALIAREFSTAVPAGIATAAPLKHVDVTFDEIEFVRGQIYKNGGPKALERARAEAASRNFMARFGECVVRRGPDAARRFLLTSPTSTDETAALAGVRPHMATCLGEGNKVGMNLYSLRGALAINFYRLAHAAQAAPETH